MDCLTDVGGHAQLERRIAVFGAQYPRFIP